MTPPVIRTLGGCLYGEKDLCYLCGPSVTKNSITKNQSINQSINQRAVCQSAKNFNKVGKVKCFILRPCTILELILSDT